MKQSAQRNSIPSIIPHPVKMIIDLGFFHLRDNTVIHTDSGLLKICHYLKDLISPSTGFDNKIETDNIISNPQNAIILSIDTELNHLGGEGYLLVTSSKSIQISAFKTVGIFYGIQTLRQLLPVEIEKRSLVKNVEWIVPCVKIEDYPRFSWRGFMLDESRHFLGKQVVKRILDILALHKMNIFHWHLTDDQGWRIEIKKYPKLVEIGSKRDGTQTEGLISFLTRNVDYSSHCGFYSQKDINEIISYAKERFIKVIPEIDIPGHTIAALAAYPEYSCIKREFNVKKTFGINYDILCSGKEKVYTFLFDIFDEIMTLFPSSLIHLGGDEVPKARWKKCSDCQAKIKTENLKDEKGLQTYFFNRIASYLVDKGKIPIIWNDALDNKLLSEIFCQFWLRNEDKVLEHLRKGRKFIISKFFYAYLDYPYTRIPLRKAYSFDPLLEELEEKHYQNILGLEAPLWTEWVSNIDRLDWQIFPRLTAHAETGWTTRSKKDYNSFKKRLKKFFYRLDLLGIKYAPLNKSDPNIFRRLFSTTWILLAISNFLLRKKSKNNRKNKKEKILIRSKDKTAKVRGISNERRFD